jgi:hypothetical protein
MMNITLFHLVAKEVKVFKERATDPANSKRFGDLAWLGRKPGAPSRPTTTTKTIITSFLCVIIRARVNIKIKKILFLSKVRVMKAKKFAPIFTLQLDNVDNKVELQKILLDLSRHARTIFAIHRQSDFEKLLSLNTVFIQMSDAKEYERLVEKRMILIGEQIVRVKKRF